MKSTLLPFLSLAFFTTSALADDTGGNHDLCVQNKDPGICTLAVVSNHFGGSDPITNVFVFDNVCDSIVEANDKDMNGLDLLNIDSVDAPVSVLFAGGKILTLDEKESGDIWKHPPLFTYEYEGDSGDDYQESKSPCKCAHSKRVLENVDVQACNCWFRCS